MRSRHATAGAIIRKEDAAPDLEGNRLVLVRAAWAALVSLNLALFVVSVPALFVKSNAPPEPVRAELAQLGLSAGFYASYLTALQVLFTSCCLVVAGVIAWRRSADFMGLLASLFLVLLGTSSDPNLSPLVEIHPSLTVPAKFFIFLACEAQVLFLLTFPDGRLVPRWIRLPAAVWTAAFVVVWFAPGNSLANPSSLSGVTILFGYSAGAIAQIYRYVRRSNRTQRQQTKWVVLGLAAAIVGLIAGVCIDSLRLQPGVPTLFKNLGGTTLVTSLYFFVPLSIGAAILRYRLWDIDVIINRALVYGALTASVVGLYVLVVGGISALLQVQTSFLVSLFATGLIAVLFAPLRNRLQRAVDRLMYGERDDPYAVISRLGERLESTFAPDAVLPTIVETVKEALKVPYVAIALKGDDVPVASTGDPVTTPLRLPLSYQNELVGELMLGLRPGSDTFGPADRRLLEVLARQAGVAAHAVRLTTDLQRSRRRLVAAREEERRRLRRDLHDGLGAQLAGLNVQTGVLRRLIPEDPVAADEAAVELRTELQSAIADIRRLVYDLRPPALDDLGLVSALGQLADRYGAEDERLKVSLDAPEDLPPLPAAVEVAVYRISQEALTNVVRHAHAHSCVVRLAVRDETILDIIDDGVGITEAHTAGVGLFSMRERAAELGGTCAVERVTDGGTRVSVRLPLPEDS